MKQNVLFRKERASAGNEIWDAHWSVLARAVWIGQSVLVTRAFGPINKRVDPECGCPNE